MSFLENLLDFFTPSTTKKIYVPASEESNIQKHKHSSEYYDFEEKYLDKIEAKYDSFCSSLDDLYYSFNESYDYKKRLSIIKKANERTEKFFEYIDSLGPFGMECFLDFYGETDFVAPASYDVDFDFHSENHSAWKWLENLYTTEPDHVTEVIHRQYISDNYSSEEEYLEELATEEAIKKLSRVILRLLKDNGNTMKKTDIIKSLDEDQVEFFNWSISRLESSNKIIRSKEKNRIVYSLKQ